MKSYGFVLVLCAGVCLGGTVRASIIAPGTYVMNNHPDGAARQPLYGFRLDELYNVTGGHDIFTFDFEHADSEMWLTYNGTSIHIHGTSYGGHDIGSTYDATYAGLWDIDFTYAVTTTAGGDDDLIVTTADYSNTGTITRQATGEVIDLFDFSGMWDYTFRLGDEDNDAGHRGFAGISGWGWVDHHAPQTHVAASDWLFTIDDQPIPEPSTLFFSTAGLAALLRRRGRRSAA